ncbi:PREDICTED: nephrin [Cyprinodon variegatus]|uniref:nephrin n=1 Tax=Cyprinodon variegatus TaxID=28743 RepID=UPI0007425853|nr:PREDICTED: nephrin [Cyprinodon variegatus]
MKNATEKPSASLVIHCVYPGEVESRYGIGQYNLRIENAQLEDDASFECQAGQSERSDAIISNIAFLTVQIPPSKPYFIMDVKTPWVAGKKYRIECVAPDAKPDADICLYKDGVDLTGATSFTTSGSKDKLLNTHAEVTFTALKSDNGRELTCHANNEATSQPVVTTVTMNVYYPPDPPYIIGLERNEIIAGKLLVLECVSDGGNPLATLQWTKVNSLQHLLNQDAKNPHWLYETFYFTNPLALGCQNSFVVLTKSEKVTCFFFYMLDPVELTLSGSLEAVEGQELTLSCHASSSNPAVHIRWWLGYKELNNTGVTIEEGENGGMTTSSNVTHQVFREDNGLTLTCEAFNNGTHVSKIQMAKLTVFYPPQKVFIESPPEDVPLRSGTRVKLVCHSTGGNPPAKLTWFKNGKEVFLTQAQTSSHMVVTLVLNLVLTASDNQADYRCDATNEAMKTISAHAKLLVQFKAVSMKITAKQEELRPGQEINLECLSGSSNPKSNISWSVGSVRYQGVEETPTDSLFGGVSVLSRLHLKLTSKHHNQKVICQAYSPVLKEGSKTFYHLNVLYPPEFSPEKATEVQVVEDDVAIIPLLVSANPEVLSCIWHHGRQMLVKGEDLRHKWTDDHSLEIRNVTRKDAGIYTVKCENDEGVNQTTFTLDVLYGPNVKAEKDPVFVNQGGIADLICVADANPIIPDMFSWKWLGEEEVEMGEETQEDESSLLTIHNVTRAHAGFYQCTASNSIALPASVEMQLVVQFTPELWKGPQWSKVASRGDGTTTAELVCQAEGIPRVEFIWGKKGMLIDLANPRYEERTVREGSFHTSTLRVVNVSAALDYAVFSCTARNSLGEDKLDIQLVSTNHPDPPSSVRQVSVTHDSVTLEWIPGFNGGLQQRFRIRYIWDNSISFMYVDVVPPDTTTFTVTGLQPLTTYNFSVNALNAIGESGYADNGAVLIITTKEALTSEGDPLDDDAQSPRALTTHLTVAFTVVFGVVLVLNSLGCFLGRKWKNRRDKTKAKGDRAVNGQKLEEEMSSQSTASNSNKYESREKINIGAQHTLLIDSGSETESNIYESYTAFQEDSRYYYPAGDYKPSMSPRPGERRGLGVIAENFESHLYEEVGDRRVYQDITPYPPFFSERRQTQQMEDLKSSTFPEKPGQFMDHQHPERDYDLPFELRGELV